MTLGKTLHIHCSGTGDRAVRRCAGLARNEFAVSNLNGNADLKRTNFCKFSLWQVELVMKVIILDNFNFGRQW